MTTMGSIHVKDKADALNRQFKSVFTNEDTSNLPDLDESRTPELQRINVTTEGVEKLLKDLQPQKAPGPDGITPRILKLCATSIAPILQCIFQKSLDTGVLPSDWLHANVVPIFKGGTDLSIELSSRLTDVGRLQVARTHNLSHSYGSLGA